MKFRTIIREMSSQGDWSNLYQTLFGHTSLPPISNFAVCLSRCEEIEALHCESSLCICIYLIDMVKYRLFYLY